MHLYHATPLHYLPHILQSGALYAKSILAAQGIKPRAGAVRRDKRLGLSDWLHLSTRPDTPLLRDKLRRGYPHALLVFDRAAVLSLPEVALLPYNTKAWRTRSAYLPITDTAEKAEMLQRHDQTHLFPSLEVLVHYGLDFTHLQRIAFAAEDEYQWIRALVTVLGWKMPATLEVDTALFGAPAGIGEARLAARDYLAACCEAAHLLPPPDIAFD
ncbi:MAG: hypothetical protein ACRYFS_06205 [Janthinobacterium lividum]